MKLNPYLKTVDPELDRQVRQTYAGQAHWAGTGPQGATCGKCSHWSGGAYSSSGSCREFLRRMRSAAPKKEHRIPREALACNAFLPVEKVQP